MDHLHLDVLGPFPISSSGNKYVLVIMDQFTRWVEAFPIPGQGAETTAKKLVKDFMSRFGAPLELHTEQGCNFEIALFKSICQLFQISKARTSRCPRDCSTASPCSSTVLYEVLTQCENKVMIH